MSITYIGFNSYMVVKLANIQLKVTGIESLNSHEI